MSDQSPEGKPSSERKVMLPEVLPRPMSFPGTAARARVIAHLRLLAATGAATLSLAACPFLVVDPLPPPAKCRTTRGLSQDLVASVHPGGVVLTDGGTVTDAGLPDGGTPVLFTLQLRQTGTGNVDVKDLIFSSNTALVQVRGSVPTNDLEVTFSPQDPAQVVTFRFKTDCEGTAGVVLVVEARPTGSGSYDVVLTDAP